MRVSDEYGVEWTVEAGDPAKTMVNLLTNQRGYNFVVLPRETLVHGTLPLLDVDPSTLIGVRMQDCLTELWR